MSWLIAHRHAVVAAHLVAAGVAGLFALQLRTEFDPQSLVHEDTATRADVAWVEATFPSVLREPIVVVASTPRGPVDALESIHDLALELAAVPGVQRVSGLTATPFPQPAAPHDLDSLDQTEPVAEVRDAIERIALAHPERYPAGLLSFEREPMAMLALADGEGLLPDARARAEALLAQPGPASTFVSRDQRSTLLALELERGAEPAAVLERLDAVLARTPLPTHRTGLPVFEVEMNSALRTDAVRVSGLAFLSTLLLLVLGVRTLRGVAYPLAAVGIAIALVLGGMTLGDIPLDLLTNMLPPLLLTTGLAEALHVVLRHDELRRSGSTPREASVAVARTLALPCLVTTGTTAIGFAALIPNAAPGLSRFGAVAAAASLLTWAVTIGFVPAALAFAHGSVGDERHTPKLDRVLAAVARFAGQHRQAIVFAAVALGLLASAFATRVETESRLLDALQPGSPARVGAEILERDFGGFRSIELGLEGDSGDFFAVEGQALLAEVSATARGLAGVRRVETLADLVSETRTSIHGAPLPASDAEIRATVDLLRALQAPLSRYVTDDGRAARIELHLEDLGAARTLALLDTVAATLRAYPVRVRWAGEAVVASRGLVRVTDALGGLGIAIALIAVVTAISFRSLTLAAVALPPTLLPLVVLVGGMGLFGVPLSATTVIVFTVVVGLAIDGSTHIVARFREELAHDPASALARTIRGSGRPVLLASASLLVGFAVLLTSSFEPIRLFGALSLLAIGGATVSQVLVLPALLATVVPRSTETPRARPPG